MSVSGPKSIKGGGGASQPLCYFGFFALFLFWLRLRLQPEKPGSGSSQKSLALAPARKAWLQLQPKTSGSGSSQKNLALAPAKRPGSGSSQKSPGGSGSATLLLRYRYLPTFHASFIICCLVTWVLSPTRCYEWRPNQSWDPRIPVQTENGTGLASKENQSEDNRQIVFRI